MTENQKLKILINHLSPGVFSNIREYSDFESAISILNNNAKTKYTRVTSLILGNNTMTNAYISLIFTLNVEDEECGRKLYLDKAFNQVLSLEMTEANSQSFNNNSLTLNTADTVSALRSSQNNCLPHTSTAQDNLH